MLPVALTCHGFFVTLHLVSVNIFEINYITMKNLYHIVFFALAAIVVFGSCRQNKTYAEQKKEEREAINSYLSKNSVKVITEDQFAAQNYTTDVSKNEFVLFESNGLYLQIIRKGCGKPLAVGESSDILVRFTEYNLKSDSLQLSNDVTYFSSIPEVMNVTNTSGSFSGSFDTKHSLMYSAYTKESVPAGWLFPLTYVNVGRPVNDDDELAQVRVIVPSAQGHYYASTNVYPCLYDLTYQKSNN